MPSHCRPSTKSGVVAFCAFLGAILYAFAVQATCGCFACLSGASCGLRTAENGDAFATVTESLDEVVPHAEFRLGSRWTSTANNGTSSRTQGQPIDVTWGIVADGTSISGSEGRSPSDLINMLNTEYGSGGRLGIENAPWFRLFEDSFARWSELSGVTYTYEPNDGGAEINNTTTPSGRPGVYPDARIGGHSIDGSMGQNTLAYNYFPNHGDMVIDTDNSTFYGSTFQDSRRLRNVLMHEAGHGLGLRHLESSDSGQLMEPTITTAFDGPQIDDILAIQRHYGDVYEKNGGNDSLRSADPIGPFADGDAWAIGTDGDTNVVSATQTDFISIDDDSDTDYFVFTVTEPSLVDIRLEQVGRSYQEGPQGGTQTRFNASTLNTLNLELQTPGVTGVLETTASVPASRISRMIEAFEAFPGRDYYVEVTGTQNNVQLYQLDLAFTALPVPEPTAIALVLLGLGACPRSRRAA